jgi:DNA-binding beta-propeller fold protein YncE
MAFTGAPASAASPAMVLSTEGIGSGSSSPKGFAFNPALTIAYVADNRSAASGGGIHRFNWIGSAWVYAYTLGYTLTPSQQVWELTADFSGPHPILYVTTGEATENHLASVTDTGPGSAYTILATAPPGDAFRGVAFAPVK